MTNSEEIMSPDNGPEPVSDVMRPDPDAGTLSETVSDMIPPQRGTVRDIMTAAPVGVYYSQTIGETARVMRDAQVGAVLVVNEGALAGVVTDRDLVIRGLAQDAAADAPVGPLCSGDLVGVAAEASLEQAQQLMREHAVRRLPVIADGQVVGILSIGDLAITAEGDSPLAAVSRAAANT
jgi:CBS domain-containing protein